MSEYDAKTIKSARGNMTDKQWKETMETYNEYAEHPLNEIEVAEEVLRDARNVREAAMGGYHLR